MNFIVKSREDIDFGALPGVLAADILKALNRVENGISVQFAGELLLLSVLLVLPPKSKQLKC